MKIGFKTRISLYAVIVLLFSFGLWVALGLIEYGDFRNSVNAYGTCGNQDGGYVSAYMKKCVLDSPCTPATGCTACMITCPFTSSVWQIACAGFEQITATGQYGTAFMTPTSGFSYSGGGAIPIPGMAFLLCGPSTVPLVIGVPGSSRANNIQKTIDWLDKYIIANYEKLTN